MKVLALAGAEHIQLETAVRAGVSLACAAFRAGGLSGYRIYTFVICVITALKFLILAGATVFLQRR